MARGKTIKRVVDAEGKAWFVKPGWYDKKSQEYIKGKAIAENFIALDTETANNHAEIPQDLRTWIHSIQLVVGAGNDKREYLFRNPWDLVDFLREMYDEYNLEPKDTDKVIRRIVVYIHNASYDLSYLIPYLRTLPNKNAEFDDMANEGIIKGKNDILLWIWGGFEFRCSKYLSNRALAKWAKDLQTSHQKRIGLLDYDKVIYSDSELTEGELEYSMEDVWVLHECVEKQMKLFNDNLISIPKTSTGYVRREFQKVCDKSYHKNVFEATKLTTTQYKFCMQSYSGGYTHNNRWYADCLIRVGDTLDYFGKKIFVENIGHGDFKSHYPSQMRVRKFPMGRFNLVYNGTYHNTEDITIDDIINLSEDNEYSTLSVIRIYDAVIKDERISMPFMQVSKCFRENPNGIVKVVVGESCFSGDYLVDNGRILSAHGRWLMALDDYTLKILNDQYKLNYEVILVWKAKNDYLPTNISGVVDKYFKAKSDLKNKGKELEKTFGLDSEEFRESQVNLQVVKAMLNAIYGCCATNPLRDEYEVGDNMDFPCTTSYTQKNYADGLNVYYSNPKNCLPYQWGVWITAAARYELYEYITAIGYENVLYCDTDSIFYIKNEQTQNAIDKLNAEKHKTAPYVVLDNGNKEYYDYFDQEEDLNAFKGLHSKCYGVVTHKDVLKVTIAGVSDRQLTGIKEDGELEYTTREMELAGEETDPYKALDNLEDETEFIINAGMSAIYIGSQGYGSEHSIEVLEDNGHTIYTSGGCVLRKLDKKVIHTIDVDDSLILKAAIGNLIDM